MKIKLFILCFTILLISGQIVFGQEKGVGNKAVSKLPAKEKRWALIIGVGKYEDDNITPLPGANNDARALRDALRDYAGFDEKQIILLTTDESKDHQPTKNNILRYLGNLSGTVPKDGLLLVAFSGHGIERQKQAFLLASDTPYNDNVRVLERTAISVSDDFKELVRDTGVGQVIILLDACRNDPSSGRSSSDNALTQAYKDGFSFDVRNREVEAFATLYATSIGERAYEYTRENKGYFTWAFIEGLKGGAANSDGEVTLGALIRYVEKYVPQQVKIDLGSSKLQRPFSIVEGFRAEELVLGIAKSERNNPLSPAQIAWNNFRGLARSLLKYDFVSPFSEGLALVRVGKHPSIKYGFIDKNGKEIIQLKYNEAETFSDSVAWVKAENSDVFKIINKNGKEIPTQNFEYIESFSNGIAIVSLNEKYGFINKQGKFVVPPKYDFVGDFSENLAWVQVGNKYGFVDKTGREIISPKYDEVMSFSDGLAFVKRPSFKGFMDSAGKEIFSSKFDTVYGFSEGLAGACLNKKCGFVGTASTIVIRFIYDDVGFFSQGIARVILNGKIGFINKKGGRVIQPKYDYYYPDKGEEDIQFFSEGYAPAFLKSWGYIDKLGNEITPFKYAQASPFSKGYAQVGVGEYPNLKYGYINTAGQEIIKPKYEIIWCDTFIEEGFIGVILNGKKGFVDIYGNEYFDF